jgi:hypothetical protein
MIDEERKLWRVECGDHALECVMITCCAGAELEVRKIADNGADAEIVLRELYPMKSDLYERARALERELSV